ncbi:hypothetical protein [Labedaea rhizosphaerae]|uniref:Dolichyl-phosphate-mannose-protein mannosyltransferase n=1 Tax=Labedaea rhizosphaerae TaxID=598644 RepID=A0A4R6SMP8_LABRH|nr:hypothetical protein [Labedaea rhizosphaerae]TDQ04840.1 hypothetical protein EV186_101798 [Labedaea rhizosphaerae]
MSATELTRSEPDLRATDLAQLRTAAVRRVRLARLLRLTAPALIFLGIREFSLLVVSWMTSKNQMSMGDALTSWDGQWFLAIARNGYDGVPGDLVDAFNRRADDTPMAFFPGYPTVTRWLAGADGPGGIGYVAAALAVTIVCGVVCSYGLARLGTIVPGGSRKVGLVLVALFAAAPMSIVLEMTYSEAMFCALAVWAVLGVLERNWLVAGVACGLAGLVRPTSAALIAAVGVAAIVAVVRKQDGWRPWATLVLAPFGLVAYLLWVASRTDDLFGWFTLQDQGWDSGFDGGAATVKYIASALATGSSVLEVATVGLIVAALVLLGAMIRGRLPWPLIVYGAGVLVMDLGSNGLFNSKARLMVPAFVLLLPLAIGLVRRRPATLWLTLAGFVLAGCWFGAYSITGWHYAI